jgi:hypothetical protein
MIVVENVPICIVVFHPWTARKSNSSTNGLSHECMNLVSSLECTSECAMAVFQVSDMKTHWTFMATRAMNRPTGMRHEAINLSDQK